MPSNNDAYLNIIKRLNFLEQNKMLHATKKAKQSLTEYADAIDNSRIRIANELTNINAILDFHYKIKINLVSFYGAQNEYQLHLSNGAIYTLDMTGIDMTVMDYIRDFHRVIFGKLLTSTETKPKYNKCPYCGVKADDDKYCVGCGAPL